MLQRATVTNEEGTDERTLHWLENLELVQSIEYLGDYGFGLELLYAGSTMDVEAAYTNTGVLYFRLYIQDESLTSSELANEIVEGYYAKTPGRFAIAEANMVDDIVTISCWVPIYAPEHYFRDELADFLEEHLNASLMKFCMDCAEIYRAVIGDPTAFYEDQDIGRA